MRHAGFLLVLLCLPLAAFSETAWYGDGGSTAQDMDGDLRPCPGTCDMGTDELLGTPALSADVYSISGSSGGVVNLYLFGDAPNGGRGYIMLGSVTGTAPGTPLPGGMATLPLNWDLFTNIVIQLLGTPACQNFIGHLTWGSSTAWAAFDTLGPIPVGVGLTISFAYALNNPWDFASNPVNIDILP